jgi:AcrR family transcriptional regulator
VPNTSESAESEVGGRPEDTDTPVRRRRDAGQTRQLLIDVARRRFARDGYAATTVRDITDEAGVNVALVSRYFATKEGLFEACLVRAVDQVGHAVDDTIPLARVASMIAGQLAGPEGGQHSDHLVLLLRSSGDAGAEQVRQTVLRSIAARLAAIAGPHSDHTDEEQLLRAQLIFAAALGIALMRATSAMEPLASADRHALQSPLQDLVDAVLGPTRP